jgi:hypothetical protein
MELAAPIIAMVTRLTRLRSHQGARAANTSQIVSPRSLGGRDRDHHAVPSVAAIGAVPKAGTAREVETTVEPVCDAGKSPPQAQAAAPGFTGTAAAVLDTVRWASGRKLDGLCPAPAANS